jgi:hypothetical protein
MNKTPSHWTKAELKTYLLLLCSKVDQKQTTEEIQLIKSKTEPTLFEKMSQEIQNDDEDTSLQKVEAAIAKINYSQMELSELRKEIYDVFTADSKYSAAERYLDKILDNLIY